MIKKIATKYAVSIVSVIIAVTLVFVPLYIFMQKQIYIDLEIRAMKTFCEAFLNRVDCSDTGEIEMYMETYDEKNYQIMFYDSELRMFYTKWRRYTGEKDHMLKYPSEYSEDAVPIYEEGNGLGDRRILLRKIVHNRGNTYYLYLRENLRNIESIFEYTNGMLGIILILYILACGISMLFLMRGLTKSIRDLNEVVKKICAKDYSVRFEGKISDDEVGMLADNFNDMVDTIQDNITSINNYNFLLKEDINHIKEYEDLRNQFVRNTTHELKTPLAIISSQIEMMHYTTDKEKQKYYYESAMEEIQKMSRLVTNFLKYSVTESRAFQAKALPINISKKIEEMCEKADHMMHVRKLRFFHEIEKDCVMNFSELHIEYVFNNYIMNAMRHTSAGGMVKVRFFSKESGYRLAVYNDGERLSEEQIEMVWKEFYSLGEREIDNVGLGLYIVKEISLIESMDCGVENCEQGVEFWFDLICPGKVLS